MSSADPSTLASLPGGNGFENISPDMMKTASSLITKMPAEELQKMLHMATSLQGQNPLSNNGSSPMPNVTPDMMTNMPPEELQKMFEMASSFNGQNPMTTNRSNISQGQNSQTTSSDGESGRTGLGSHQSFPTPSPDIRSQLKNPAMREMMSSMMKNMSPDMMASMSEQFGVKLSREDAEKAQQAMTSFSPESLDRLMKWADRIQRAGEGAVKTKNWLLGRQGLVMAVCMLLFAVFLHWLGYIGS